MKPARENPLKNLVEGDEGHKGFQIDTNKFEPKIDINEESDDDDEKGGIRDKAKAVSTFYSLNLQFDPLADFANMENAALDFETWEGKKLKIFAMFQGLTDE